MVKKSDPDRADLESVPAKYRKIVTSMLQFFNFGRNIILAPLPHETEGSTKSIFSRGNIKQESTGAIPDRADL
jgi:hypothetical protein